MATQLSKAFFPRVLVAWGSAPAANRISTTATKPMEQAVIKGVAPLAFRNSRFARFSTNNSQIAMRSPYGSLALQQRLKADTRLTTVSPESGRIVQIPCFSERNV